MSKNEGKKQSKIPAGLTKQDLLAMYEMMVLIRRFEITAQQLLKAGEMPGFIHVYIGEEATATGVCYNLRPIDFITSTHRGHGHALAKGMSPKILLAELFGRDNGCCHGRGGTMHLFEPKIGLFGTNGIVAGGIPSAVGIAMSAKTRKTDQVSVGFFGDGASNHGSFHESLNFAGAMKAPVVFVCENNLYATSMPLKRATQNPEIATRAAAYGIPGVAVDGNDVLAVYQATKEAIERARAGQGPTLIESKTYRLAGHHEGEPVAGTYRTWEELEDWKQRGPIDKLKKQLLEEFKLATEKEIEEIEARVDQQISEAIDFARNSPMPDTATVHDHVLANPINPELPTTPDNVPTVQKGWLEAVMDGIAEEFKHNPNIIYFGEGIGERGGCFGHTKGLWGVFGGDRFIDTAICELAFTGASVGCSGTGVRAVADLMFADFMFEAGSQIIHQAAKLRYMSAGKVEVPMIIRAPFGSIKQTGPHHSGSFYPMWAHIPGLLVAVPSNPADAKGLMKTALRAHDPVIFMEHKALFGSKGQVPAEEHFVPFGQAKVVQEGSDLTIVSCGLLLQHSVTAAQTLKAKGISCEVIDLRTIVPLDVETIAASVAKTGKLLIVDEAWSMCGVAAEISAAMMELAFDELDAPIGRICTDPVSFPFSPALENEFIITPEKIVTAAQDILAGRPIPQIRFSGRTSSAAAPVAPQPAVVTAPAAAPVAAAAQQTPAAGLAKATVEGIPVIMPNQDLTITEAKVVRWLKKLGDAVKTGEPVVEVETDKAVSEIESPADGILAEILAPEETLVPLAESLAIIKPK